jgi:Family of unknown function (DUF6297)
MTAPAAALPRTDPDERLTGRELRRLTARVAASHAGRGAGQVVTDVAYVVVSVLLAAGLVLGIVSAVGDAVALDAGWTAGAAQGAWRGDGTAPSSGLLHALLALVVVALVGSAAARLEPAGVGTAGVHWWIPTPADRRGLLLPSVGAGLGGGALAGAVGTALAGIAAGADTRSVLLGSLLGTAAGVVVVAVAGLLQPRPHGPRVVGAVCDVLLAAVPVLGVVLVGSGVALGPLGAWPTAPIAVAGGVGAGAVVLAALWAARVDRLALPALLGRSGALDRLSAALLSVDSRDLGRALAAGARSLHPRRALAFRPVRGPRGAIVAADAVLLARTPSSWAQLVGLAALLVLAHDVPALAAGPGLALTVLAVGARAARLGAAGAGAAEMVPALDASLPLSARGVRVARTVVPALAAAACVAAGLVPLAVATASPAWVALGALVGVGCGAGALRGMLRPEPDWSGPLLATPAGAVPVDAAAVARQGPDLLLLAAVPFAVAALLGVVTPALLLAQALVALLACAVAARPPRHR